MQIVRPILKTVDGLPARVRDLRRLQEVARVLVRHGFGALVAGLEIPGVVVPKDELATPERAVAALRELGPTFVKLGQVLSTRPDLLPEEYVAALASLQDDAGPMPLPKVLGVLVDELGPGWREHVATFDEVPIATASIAQVHGAVLGTGEEVVFKVQRPDLERTIRSDLHILQFIAGRAAVEFPELLAADLDGMLAEFQRSILSELDFLEEARNQQRIAENFEGDDRVRVPRVHAALTTRRVMCQERLRGVKISQAREAGHDMAALGERAISVVFDMLFVHGFFHADAHPGNVLVLPDGTIGLLDFGMVGRLTAQMRNDVIFIIFALDRGDYRTIARLFYEIALKPHRVDYRAVERTTVEVMEKYWSGNSIKDMRIGPFFVELARGASVLGARMPPDYTMFFKALVTVEGLAKSLLPEVDPVAAAAPYFERMIRDRVHWDRLQSDALYHLLTLSSVLRRLPISLSQFLDDLDAQRVKLDVRQVMDRQLEDRRDRRSDRLVAAIGAVGASLVGTLGLFPDSAHVAGWPVVAIVFYGIAALTALRAYGPRGRR
jgi:ubiquinone biosynthesis protein